MVSNISSQYDDTNYTVNCDSVSQFPPLFIIILSSLYALIFLLSVTGNLLVIYVVATHPAMQTVTNLFIVNLAISDLLQVREQQQQEKKQKTKQKTTTPLGNNIPLANTDIHL